jgi:hypothetical protein
MEEEHTVELKGLFGSQTDYGNIIVDQPPL